MIFKHYLNNDDKMIDGCYSDWYKEYILIQDTDNEWLMAILL